MVTIAGHYQLDTLRDIGMYQYMVVSVYRHCVITKIIIVSLLLNLGLELALPGYEQFRICARNDTQRIIFAMPDRAYQACQKLSLNSQTEEWRWQ